MWMACRTARPPIQLAPQGAGRASIGVRMNKLFYFKGAVRMARFTRRALTPAEFLKAKPRGANGDNRFELRWFAFGAGLLRNADGAARGARCASCTRAI